MMQRLAFRAGKALLASAVMLMASAALRADFIVISSPDAAYQASTTKIDFSGLPNFTSVTSISDANLLVGFSTTMSKRQVPGGGWATWSSPPNSESATPAVLYSNGATSLTMLLTPADSGFGVQTFGFELEPNPFSVQTFTADFFDGLTLVGSIMLSPNGLAGARLFAGATTTAFFDRVVISGTSDFAIAQVRYDLTAIPEPTTLALCGMIAVGLVGYRFRRRPCLA